MMTIIAVALCLLLLLLPVVAVGAAMFDEWLEKRYGRK